MNGVDEMILIFLTKISSNIEWFKQNWYFTYFWVPKGLIMCVGSKGVKMIHNSLKNYRWKYNSKVITFQEMKNNHYVQKAKERYTKDLHLLFTEARTI